MLPSSLLSSIKAQSSGETTETGASTSTSTSSSLKVTLRSVPANERCKNNKSKAPPAAPINEYDAEGEEQAREYFFNTGIATWYETLEDLTFTTSFCDVSPSEAELVVEHWEKQQQKKNASATPLVELDQALLEEAKSKLSSLRDRLNLAIETQVSKSAASRVFVKLSTRSPKDSKWILNKAAISYKQRMSAIDNGTDSIDSSNEKWRILSEEVASASAVANVDEAMEVLLDSERVYEDFHYALEGYNTNKQSWKVGIAARAWDPRVKPHTEFRAVCWGGKLTCLAQYYHPLFFPHLLQEKDEILKDIMLCFEDDRAQKAVESLGGHCIIDFCRVAPGKTLIVELNPFDGIGLGTFPASTGLFLWDDPVDKKIMKGEADFEFRIRETPIPDAEMRKQYNKEWREIIYKK